MDSDQVDSVLALQGTEFSMSSNEDFPRQATWYLALLMLYKQNYYITFQPKKISFDNFYAYFSSSIVSLMISFQEKMTSSTDYVKHCYFIQANGMMLMDTKYSGWLWKQYCKITTKF